MWQANVTGNMNGGGFMNTSAMGDSPQVKGRGQRNRVQTVVPVCIRQITDYNGEEFKLFGMPTNVLTVVGILKEYEVQSTKATYQVEDHTGQIKAIWWLETDSNSEPNLPSVKEGSYVRIYGSLRVQEGEKFLMVLKMFAVENPNEVVNHLLEVIHVRLEAEALSKGSGALDRIKLNNPGAELANSMSFMDMDMDITQCTGFTPMQEKVFRIVQSTRNPSGIHRTAILKEFPVSQHREVNTVLEFLINEGHAYSTLDNDHFKATDSM